jgi:ABC-2 type transport system permease protein
MKTWTIIKKEYKQIVKKKSFVISTILTPIMMVGFIFLPLLMNRMSREEKVIEVIDYSGIIQQRFMERSQDDKHAGELKLKFQAPGDAGEELVKQGALIADEENFQLLPHYRQRIMDKTIDGLLLIPGNIKEKRRIYFCAQNISDINANNYMASTVRKILSEQILAGQNVQLDIVESVLKDIHVGTFKVKKEGTTRTTSGMELMMSIFMLTILFTIIMAYGQLIMRGVIEEKNNRIIEVLISSTKAATLFYGKIIGIGLAGLTQVAAWLLLAVMFLGQGAGNIDESVTSFLTLELAVYFVIFFIIGYFMYSILFSIVGASVNTDQEAQQFSTPIVYLLLIPLILSFIVAQSPGIPLVVISSLFPLFSPTLMFMRISVALPPFVQILASIVGSVLFTVFLAWLGAKIFRVGILMYGKKPSIQEILKWTRYK